MQGYNFTERVRRALAEAREVAADLGHSYVGTEHLLLGLLAEGKGVAAGVLQSSGITLDRARLEMLAVIGGPDVPTAAAQLPLKGEKPTSVGLILRYSNGAVVTKSFASPAEA